MYRDNKGNHVYVAKHGDFWITVIETESGVKRFTTKNLPVRDTEWEAQADLHKFAKKRKWANVNIDRKQAELEETQSPEVD